MVAGGQGWYFPSGMVAARLDRLLSLSDFQELLRLGQVREIISRLRRSALAPQGERPESPFAVEEGWLKTGMQIDRLFRERASEIGQVCPDSSVVDVFGLKQAALLLKRYWKSRLKEGVRGGRLTARPQGIEPQLGAKPEVEGLARREVTAVPLERAMERARALVSDQSLPVQVPAAWLVDLIFDSAVLQAQLELAEQLAQRWGSPALAQVLRSWVELQTFLLIARAQRRPALLPAFRRYFQSPVPEAVWFEALYREDGDGQKDRRQLWREAIERLLESDLLPEVTAERWTGEFGHADEIERLAHRGDEIVMDRVRALRWVPFGPEPVFGYLWGLRAEADNLKAVVGGLQAGVATEIIRQRLRATYV